MVDKYNEELLRVAVAQICQTIGYSSAQSAPLELLQDLLHKFLIEFTRNLRHKTEHTNRIVANLKDTYISLRSLNVNITELLDYISNVEPVPFVINVPRYPVRKASKLNFLKPGSKESLTRPMHYNEYLPPIFPSEEIEPKSIYKDDDDVSHGTDIQNSEELLGFNDRNKENSVIVNNPTGLGTVVKTDSTLPLMAIWPSEPNHLPQTHGRSFDDLLQSVRDSSVTMTTGGCISPATEGKCADSFVPEIIEKLKGLDEPPPPETRPVTPISSCSQSGSNVELNPTQLPITNASCEVVSNSYSLTNPQRTEANQKLSQHNFIEMATSKASKKSKKKINMPQAMNHTAKNFVDDIASSKADEKSKRKAIKMLRKLSKSVKNSPSVNALDKPRTLESSLVSPTMIAALPKGSVEKLRLEKLLRKQTKQRQKALKHQIPRMFKKQKNINDKSKSDIDTIQTKQQIEEFASTNLETSNILNSQLQEINQSFKNESCAASLNRPIQSVSNINILNDNKNTDKLIETKGNVEISTTANNNELEIKLSNEPDRNKLNIFKKISKTKPLKSISPNNLCTTPFNNTSESPPIIHLPSGTTITPAPTLIPSSPCVEASNNYDKINRAPENTDLVQPILNPINILPQPPNTPNEFHSIDGNKPKKRGRKPGSKNQIKNTQSAHLLVQTKKSKQKLIYGPNMIIHPNQMPTSSVEPLNLSNTVQLNKSPLNINSLQAGSSIPLSDFIKSHDVAPSKERIKERKKYKSKYNSLGAQVHELVHADAAVKEQLNFPNKNVWIHDPSSPLLTDSAAKGSLKQTITSQSSNIPVGGINNPHIPPNDFSAHFLGQSAFLPSTLPGATTFPNTQQQKMLPMLPLFAFPPRPGLIPSGPSLFSPVGLANFTNNSPGTNKGTNMLMPPFLPFPNLSSTASKTFSQDKNYTKLVQMASPKEQQQLDRSFCNKAPIIMESNNLNAKEISTSCKVDVTDFPSQTPILSPTPNSADLLKRFANFSTADIKNPMLSKQISNTTGSSGLPNVKTSTGNSDDPIEVSDDSGDTPTATKISSSTFSTVFPTQFPINKPMQTDLTGIPSGIQMFTNLISPNSETKKIQKQSKPLNLNNETQLKTIQNTFSLDLKGVDKLSLAGGADLIPISGNTSLPCPPSKNISLSIAKSTPNTPDTSALQLPKSLPAPTDVSLFRSETSLKRRKEHKKIKKLKEGKIKKKKDKKDKSKHKIRSGDEKHLHKNEKLAKDLEKKLKKEKKKEKQRFLFGASFASEITPHTISTNTSTVKIGAGVAGLGDAQNDFVVGLNHVSNVISPKETASPSHIPKLTLRIGSNSKASTPLHFDETNEKEEIVPDHNKRAHSPELARFSPLVTRPPKHKQGETQNFTTGIGNSTNTNLTAIESFSNPVMPTPSSWLQGGTLTASSVLLPQQLLQTPAKSINPTPSNCISNPTNISNPTTSKSNDDIQILPNVPEASRPSSYVDSEGNRIWICPACGKVDDGSPMIGCDGCDAWYHWICVGIVVAPKDNEDWFCRVCITRRKVHGSEKKRKRAKKK